MKHFIRNSKGVYFPLDTVTSIQTVENHKNMFDVYFNNGSRERISDLENVLRDTFIG